MRKNYRRLNYRRVLIAIIAVIIALLLIIFFVVSKRNNNIGNRATEITQEEIIKIGIDTQKNEIQNQTQTQSEKKEEQKKQETKTQEIITENKTDNQEQTQVQNEENENKSETSAGTIYLTFDDGPTSDSTPAILDILKKRNIKATFFVLHYNDQNAQYIKREHQEGHTVALHGYTHTYSEVYQSADTCLENFRKIGEQVYNTIGVNSKIIRFPGGSSNTVSKKYCQGVMTEVTQRAIKEGYRYFDWNVDSDDAGKAKTSERIYNNVTNGVKPNRDNVVLMHDFSGNHKTIDALEDIITWGLEQGYEFKKITRETPMVTHSVNN